jgi:hypothetical protein
MQTQAQQRAHRIARGLADGSFGAAHPAAAKSLKPEGGELFEELLRLCEECEELRS